VTRRAHETGYNRTAIYNHAQRVEQAVVNKQVGGISYEVLWADNERLRTENEALWEAWAEAESLLEAKQQAFAATGCEGIEQITPACQCMRALEGGQSPLFWAWWGLSPHSHSMAVCTVTPRPSSAAARCKR
jgi:hypothetical protein